MARIGYARISTTGQHEESQLDELERAGCDKVFVDKVTGKLASRPEWDRCLAYLRPGDTLVITRLSRAARSLHNLLDVMNGTEIGEDGKRHGGLADQEINLVVLKQAIDTTTPAGRLTFHILAAIDEFQRELIVEGTHEGLAAARARGRVGGRKPKLTAAQESDAMRMYDSTGADGKRLYTVADIAAKLRVSRPTIYAAIERQRGKAAAS